MRILDAREPFKIKEHSKVIDIFRPELDVVGLTTDPSPFHQTPADPGPDYYSWVYRHARKSDQILLMEAGWPTRGPAASSSSWLISAGCRLFWSRPVFPLLPGLCSMTLSCRSLPPISIAQD